VPLWFYKRDNSDLIIKYSSNISFITTLASAQWDELLVPLDQILGFLNMAFSRAPLRPSSYKLEVSVRAGRLGSLLIAISKLILKN
jgi:hypothetical protein